MANKFHKRSKKGKTDSTPTSFSSEELQTEIEIDLILYGQCFVKVTSKGASRIPPNRIYIVDKK